MKLAVIGGSGLYDFPALGQRKRHRVMTPWGEPSASVISGQLQGVEMLFLARHGESHQLPPHRVNYRANVAALAELGATAVIGTAAVGGMTSPAGTIVIPHQLIDYTWGREHTYSDGSQPHPMHVDFTDPYSPALRAGLIAAAADAGLDVLTSGVYAATQGPRLETAAEIDRLERDGCTLVGMTGMPEAALAREIGLEYANVSLVVNAAAGRQSGPITMEQIESALQEGMIRIQQLIISTAKRLSESLAT